MAAGLPGLLWAYAGAPNGEAVRLSADELSPAVGKRDWVWINVDRIDQRARGWITSICEPPTDVTTVLAGQDVGLAFEQVGDEIHGVCADYNIDYMRLSDSIGQFGFVVRERLLVTGWRRSSPPSAGLPASGCARSGPISTGSRTGSLASRALDERTALKEVRRLALALHRPVAAMLMLLRGASSG